MGEARRLKQFAQMLRRRDRPRAYEHRPADLMHSMQGVYDRRPLRVRGDVDLIRHPAAANRPIGRNGDDRQAIHRPQLPGHLPGGPGHSGKAQIAAKEALVTDPRERLLLPGDRAAFLRLDHLMQPALPGPVRHHAAGVLVHDLHLVRAHQVLLVALEKIQGRERTADQLLAPSRADPDAAVGFRQLGGTALAEVGQLDVAFARPDGELRA